MFSKSAAFYDAIYSWKDYPTEAEQIHALIQQYRQSGGMSLLDTACGTGAHARHLRQHYTVTGFDLDPDLLGIARQTCPEGTFHEADMCDFDLGRQFDAITCLFSAIGYVKTPDGLNRTLACFARHTRPGGVVIVEPWFGPGDMTPDTVHARFVDEPDLKISRINITRVEGTISSFTFHYLVGTSESVEYFTEFHEMGLFTDDQYRAAFRTAGLTVHHDPQGLMGRGLYIGVKPAE
jgi:ubiquinone/menaquinone biosynthesis C-methylase UbiE